MKKSTRVKAIILHLSPKITRIAIQIVPFDEFLQYAQAVLEDTCQKTVSLHPDLPLRSVRDIVFEDVVTTLGASAGSLLKTLQTGRGEGRATLSANGESFLVDLRSDFPKQ